jgi:hypothetical protein
MCGITLLCNSSLWQVNYTSMKYNYIHEINSQFLTTIPPNYWLPQIKLVHLISNPIYHKKIFWHVVTAPFTCKFSFLPSLSLIIKPPFFVTSSQVPVEAYNLCTTGDDDKEKTKHTCGVSFRACVSLLCLRVCVCVFLRECACLLVSRDSQKIGSLCYGLRRGGFGGAALDSAGVLAADNISGTVGTICWVPMGARGNPYSHSIFFLFLITKM